MRWLESANRWLCLVPAYRYLTARPGGLPDPEADSLEGLWRGLVLWSLATGGFMVAAYAAGWTLMGEPVIRGMPAALCIALPVLWLRRRSVAALAEMIGGADRTARATAGAALVAVAVMAVVNLQPMTYRWDGPLPWLLAWIRPTGPKLYRVLLLMPLWGAWSVLITPQLVRPHADRLPVEAALARGCGALTGAVLMGLMLALTITYFSFMTWACQLGIVAAVLTAALAGGVGLSKLAGGPGRRALLAADWLTQMVLLGAYLVAQNLL